VVATDVTRQRGHMPDNPHQNVSYPSNGGRAHGYLSTPAAATGPGVIVIQEWWGLTDQIVDVSDALAQEGFVALAPDLYGGATTHDADEAGRLMAELPVDQAARDLGGAVDFLLGHDAVSGDAVGAVGFCMGGGFVLVLAAQQGARVGAAVPYYAVANYDDVDLSGVTGPVLGHFGGTDDFVPPAQVAALRERLDAAGAAHDLRVHEGAGHAFANPEDAFGTYDAALADQAWADTLQHLNTHLS
jgi:carboxymethylenebutenolidase